MNRENLAVGTVATAPVNPLTSNSLILQAGEGANMPGVPFFATVSPPGVLSSKFNSEIIRVTDVNDDTITFQRGWRDTTAKPIAEDWVVSNSIYKEDIDFFREADITVTVGTDGEYPTVNAAIEYLVRNKPLAAYAQGGYKAEVKLLTGFTMAEQVFARSIDLSWITITSEVSEVPVDPSAITSYLVPVGAEAYSDDLLPIFGALDNAKLPTIGALFAYPNDGVGGYAAAPKDGVAVIRNSHVTLLPGAGVNRARSGIKILYKSSADDYMTGLTQGGGGIGGGTVTGVEFRYATRLAVHVGFDSEAGFARAKLDHSRGSYGIYMIWGSRGDFYQSQVHDTINGNAITARDGSIANMRETQVARSRRGYHALHAGLINARSSTDPAGLAVMWIGDAAKDCTQYGVLASYNSRVEAADLNVSGSATGVNASNTSQVSFIQGVALDCTGRGVSSVNASTIEAAGVKADGCDIGFYAENAATINANPADVTGHATANNCTSYGFVAKAASTINADTSEAANAGIDAYYSGEASTIQARNSIADDATGYGFRCERGSRINARGSSAKRCLISFYSFECTGGGINAQSANVDGSGTGYYVDRDGRINAGASAGTATLKSNVTINSQSAKGLITDADAAWVGDAAKAGLADSNTFTGANKFTLPNIAGSLLFTREDGTTGVLYVDSSSGTPRYVFGQGTTPGSLVNFNGKIYVGGGSGAATSFADFAASVAANASIRLRTGVDPTSPNDGDVWHTSTEFKVRNGSTTESLAFKSEVALKQSLSEKGAANGYAELDSSGLVPSSQLPSFVDDVVEAANFAALPGTGTTGKIYVTLDDNKTYRWSGSAYVEISSSLALGETSSTAYRGDRGKTAYDHSQATGNPHGTAMSDISGLVAAIAAKVTDAIVDGVTTAAPSQNAVFDALALKQDKTDGWKVVSNGAASSHTGNTTETTLATIPIPAGALGANGTLRLTLNFSCNTTANAKTVRARFNNATTGTQYLNSPLTSQARLHTPIFITNRNSESSQIGGTNPGNQTGYSQSTSPQVTTTVNTAVATNIYVTGQLADAADTITLETWVLEYHYQA
jgi:hypothetical protein